MTKKVRDVLVGRYSRLFLAGSSVKNNFRSLIKDRFGENISTDSISYKKGIVRLVNISPLLKNEILIKKHSLIKELNTLLGKELVLEIE